MSRRETVTTVCDLDGAHATPVPFAIDGQAYEIDLCPADKARLAGQLAPYLAAARRKQRPKGVRSEADRQATAAMRAWALEHASEFGWEIGERGRLPAEVRPAFQAAMRGGAR